MWHRSHIVIIGVCHRQCIHSLVHCIIQIHSKRMTMPSMSSGSIPRPLEPEGQSSTNSREWDEMLQLGQMLAEFKPSIIDTESMRSERNWQTIPNQSKMTIRCGRNHREIYQRSLIDKQLHCNCRCEPSRGGDWPGNSKSWCCLLSWCLES
jgi:hypothetical protein